MKILQKPTLECTEKEAKTIYAFLDYLTYNCFEEKGYTYEQLIDCFNHCYENSKSEGKYFNLKIIE